MNERRLPYLDETIELLLRGAAAVLGCNSATLLLIDEQKRRVSVRIGTGLAGSLDLVVVEKLLGKRLHSVSLPIDLAQDSAVIRCWSQGELIETSDIREVADRAFPNIVVEALSKFIGRRRFLCVPTTSGSRRFGVLLFERADPNPFGAFQRDLLVRYAERIANLLADDLVYRRDRPEPDTPDHSEPFLAALDSLLFRDMTPAFLVDQSRAIVAANAVAAWLVGEPAEALVGRPLASLFSEGEPVDPALDAALFSPGGESSDGTPQTLELRVRAGGRAPVEITPLLLVHQDDSSAGMIVQVRPGGRATQAGVGAWEEVVRRERLATLGELAAQLAHEVRNPLVAVGAALENLAVDYAHDSELSDELSLLNREILRMDLILRDYLTMAGRHRITLGYFELPSFMEESARVARAHRKATGYTLDVSCPPDLSIRADRDGLRQVLLNLWLNAFEASPAGATIQTQVEQRGEHVLLSVEDEGPGPPSADPFAAFFTSKTNGTGLGLTVSRRIVEAHGGTISLAPRPEGGTSARVTLPRRPGRDG